MLKITELDSGAAGPWSQDLGSVPVLIDHSVFPPREQQDWEYHWSHQRQKMKKKEEHEVLRLKDLCSREFWPS